MVLESLMSPAEAENHPSKMFLIGLLYSSIAVFISLWIFKDQASIIMVLLTVLASVPIIYLTMKLEEKKDLKIQQEKKLLKEHSKALKYFIFLFLGFTISFTVWYIFLPSPTTQALFSSQISTINAINSRITGGTTNINLIPPIISNNLKVLFFTIFFSFFYGAGAIFILTWNASVIAAAAGSFIRNNLARYLTETGLVKIGGYFHIFSLGLLKYLLHGIPEILAYFIGGLAGGIISVAVIRHSTNSKAFKHVLLDSIDLIILAVLLLVVAALMEVFITPLFF